MDNEDDFDKDDLPPQAIKPKPEKAVSHKLNDIQEGFMDCYWCGRQFEINKMRRERKYDIVCYICKDCQ